MLKVLNKLMHFFNRSEKKKLLILLFMMILAALLETVGVGLILPLVGIILSPEIIQKQYLLSEVFRIMNFKSTEAFILFSVIFLLVVFVFKNLYILLYNYVQYKVILNHQVKLSKELFKEYLTKPYTFHLNRNTSDLLRNVNEEVPKVFQGIILSGFQLFTEVLVITFILILLVLVSPTATITASIILGGSVLLFFRFFRKKITYLGKEVQSVNGLLIKCVNQGLGASKEIKVSGKEEFFVNAFIKQSLIKMANSRYIKMLEVTPRLFIETLLVSIVLLTMLIIMLQETETTRIISTMALFAMAAFRLMPSIIRVVALISTIKYSKPALDIIYEDLFINKDMDTDETDKKKQYKNNGFKSFKNEIKLNSISYRYPNQKDYSISNLSLKIPIGQSVAFIGESGAGKTTVVDIILGLLKPNKGEVLVDGKSLFEQIYLWQQKIGYVPQNIYLSDDTIRENVAFGMAENEIDDKEVWRALEQAQLKDFVLSLPEQLETSVGERGVRLSGGQRQRIGIARALYNDPEILFMDEATSALDNETEKEIMKAVDGLKGEKTLIIIAHRLSTIENCDIVFELSKGRVTKVTNDSERSII